MTEKIEEIASGLSDLETPIRQAGNLAKALRMISSSDEMPGEQGEGVFGVADALVDIIESLQETRVTLWHLAKGEAS
jgi:hypothetical protein